MSKSKHNYSQYSKNTNKSIEIDPTMVEQEIETVNEEVAEPVVESVIEVADEPIPVEQIKPEPMYVMGTVSGCVKLNVRANPKSNADVVCVINADSELKVDMSKSDNEWFYINTASGVEGYCMRKFVDVTL